jgi:RNA-directed DNA polymerase
VSAPALADQLTQRQTRWSTSLPSSPNPALVGALLSGDPSTESIVARCSQTLGKTSPWLRPLARRYLKHFSGQTRPRHSDVVQFLVEDTGFRSAFARHSLSVKQWFTESQQMQPVAAAAQWNLPPIESISELSRWLLVTPEELQWLADLKGLERISNDTRLRHYHYRTLTKRSGSIRLIEIPKPKLKQIQRKILTEILNLIPPHPAVHGFIRGRSIKTFAAPHVRQSIVLRMDLRDFFPSISARQIQSFFRTAGYPESVADHLGGLCTNTAPRSIWHGSPHIDSALRKEARLLYSRPHLPQGAPTSPALANLCAYRMDCRLNGLAQSVGATYTRYADDLAFSGGGLHRNAERFATHVAAILLEERFAPNYRKTRIMRQGVRQHLAGLVVNQRTNIRRADFDRLKATLTNCVRLGPESQNRDALPHFRLHLEGKVEFVRMIHPAKGDHLLKILDQIQWP